jgi:hypothetical protein
MPTFRFEPIAQQLRKIASPALLFPPPLLEDVRRGQTGLEVEPSPPWSPAVREFMAHYMAVVRAARLLLGAPAFERLARLSDELDELYTPGRPPMSPVYDSYSVQHVLGEIPQGLVGETPYSVLAQLSKGDPARARLQELAESLARSHLDLYRVTRAEQQRAEVVRVRGGEAVSLHLTGPFLREGDLLLGRAVAFGSALFMADSPYLLEASAGDWLDYLQRAAQPPAGPAAPTGPSPSPARPAGKPRLTSKQAARRRQEQKRKAAPDTSGDAIVRHLQRGPSERFWLEFIMDAYAGERNGVVRLAGVPDRPETLPHADRGEAWGEPDEMSPLARVREALIDIAAREGIFEREELAFEALARGLGASRPELHEADRPLFVAYCTLAARSLAGSTALDLLEREQPLDEEERLVVAGLARGAFGVLRIERVDLDAGLTVFDELRQEAFGVAERAATRQLDVGDLLLGWWCEGDSGARTLEGGALRIPALRAARVGQLASALLEAERSRLPSEPHAELAARLPLALLAQLALSRDGQESQETEERQQR